MKERNASKQPLNLKTKLMVLGIIFFSVCIIFSNLGGDNSEVKTPQEMIKSILGVPSEGEQSLYFQQGVTSVSYSSTDKSAIIDYRVYPATDDYDRDISIQMADDIKKLFESGEFNSLVFNVYLPSLDKYGNSHWQLYTRFCITLDMERKINWENFDEGSLIELSRSN